jgi:D-ribose pyranose/furanose isomerase RbsD
MRPILGLAIVLALAGCSGGGSAPSPLKTGATSPVGPQSELVTPTFTLDFTAPSSSAKTPQSVRRPNFVSSASLSVTITLTSVGGNPPNVSPTSVTTNITPPCPCTVNGPPSPPGQVDAYTVNTYDATGGSGGSGNVLDTGSTSITPTVGTNNTITITLLGVPYTVAITNVPASFSANTGSQTQNLTVTVKDHSAQTITGTYANSVRITDPDAETTNGTHLTGTHNGSSCTNSCVDMTASTDVVTLNYGGLAENAVTLASSGTNLGTAGTAVFTPLLNAITGDGANSTTLSGGGTGIDLFTTDSGSPSGYSGTVKYGELGFTNSPYNKALSLTGTGSCTSWANVTAGANTSNETPFTATAVSNPTNGICTVTVTDALTDQTNTLPTFKVTYTISNVSGSSKNRRP